MDWLNYHHLLYFWNVARLGTITKASEELLLAPPTISVQISQLEHNLGIKLFERSGRRLMLTEEGKIVFRYAQEIFSLGKEMTDTLRGFPAGNPMELVVGVADVLPKGITYRIIEPALRLGVPVRVICREEDPERLFPLLALRKLDLVLSDAPLSSEIRVRAFNHPLGECGITFMATPQLARRFRPRFPRSLRGAPLLLPTENTVLRRDLDQWFASFPIRTRVVGEFEDDALLREFAKAGVGIFPTYAVLEKFLREVHGFERIGRTERVRARVYAISVERQIKNPAVVAICETARQKLFA